MQRTYSSIDEIRAELAWVTKTPDPNKCGCRNLRCCEETSSRVLAHGLIRSNGAGNPDRDRPEGLLSRPDKVADRRRVTNVDRA